MMQSHLNQARLRRSLMPQDHSMDKWDIMWLLELFGKECAYIGQLNSTCQLSICLSFNLWNLFFQLTVNIVIYVLPCGFDLYSKSPLVVSSHAVAFWFCGQAHLSTQCFWCSKGVMPANDSKFQFETWPNHMAWCYRINPGTHVWDCECSGACAWGYSTETRC